MSEGTDRQVADLTWITLQDLLRDYVPGSQPQPWTWDDEVAYLLEQPCICVRDTPDDDGWCPWPGHYQLKFEQHLAAIGRVEEPICLGGDGRVWDGHHRIVAAIRLGFPGLPVEQP